MRSLSQRSRKPRHRRLSNKSYCRLKIQLYQVSDPSLVQVSIRKIVHFTSIQKEQRRPNLRLSHFIVSLLSPNRRFSAIHTLYTCLSSHIIRSLTTTTHYTLKATEIKTSLNMAKSTYVERVVALSATQGHSCFIRTDATVFGVKVTDKEG